MELEISSKKNDIEKCFEITEQICIEAVHHYLKALALKAKRLSMGEKRMQFLYGILCWRVQNRAMLIMKIQKSIQNGCTADITTL